VDDVLTTAVLPYNEERCPASSPGGAVEWLSAKEACQPDHTNTLRWLNAFLALEVRAVLRPDQFGAIRHSCAAQAQIM